MKYDLLLADILALLLGVFGVLALTSYCLYVNWGGAMAGGRVHLFLALAALMVAMTAFYLIPPLHQNVLRRTLPWATRIPFIGLSIIWLTVSLSYLRQVPGLPEGLLSSLQGNYRWLAFPVLSMFALLIFPLGLGYREPARERRASAIVADPAGQQYATAAVVRQREQIHGGAVPHVGRTERAEPKRKASPMNGLLWGVIVLFVGYIAYTHLIGAVTQTLLLDQMLVKYSTISIEIGSVVVWSYLATRWRVTVDRNRARWGHAAPVVTLLAVLACGPSLAVFFYGGVAYSAFPYTWNLLTENPRGELVYSVIHVDKRGRGKGCVTLSFGDSDARTKVCGLGRDVGQSLAPGDRLLVSGELSRFAHSFEAVQKLH